MLKPDWLTTMLGTMLILAIALAVNAAEPAAVPTASAPATSEAKPAATAIPKAPGFPADYKGTPYKGVAQEIPGRVEMENFDEGGFKVAFNTQHHEGSSSGKDYRTDEKPQICVTNNPANPKDFFLDGKRYPGEGKESYFIGWAKSGDWCKYTVNVKKAGVYRVNTTASSETKKMIFDISFNDVKKADYKTDTEGTANYHKWKVFDAICTVKLDAGLQVMKFHLTEQHLNYDYLEFVYDEKASAPLDTATPPATTPR